MLKMFITADSLFADVQREFSQLFPYLRLAFLPGPAGPSASFGDLNPHMAPAYLDITYTTTIEELENIFRNFFGINVTVWRKTGNTWMQPSLTRSWLLQQQNDYAAEIFVSLPGQANP